MNFTEDKQWRVKVGLAEMLKGGVIMDVTTAEQAKIAENAGACAVMALERVPADIRKEGGVARMSSIRVLREIMETVSIPVMAKIRIGHFVEAQALEQHGAVSEVVARQMAQGVRLYLDADVGISTTGVAGPSGGAPDKPVGTVWIGYADAQGEVALLKHFVKNREMNKALASTAVLDLARRRLLEG